MPMQIIASVLAILVLVGLAVQSFQSLSLIRLFQKHQPTEVPDQQLPRCAVVLCLRGCDPDLDQHLESLLAQDYPDFHLYLVVDSHSDPALAVVREVLSREHNTNATIRIMEHHPTTCSLVANNHATVLPELAEEYPVLALVDADAETWPTWLRTLVSPLIDSDLGMVYGNRWYMPTNATFASLCRFIWNYGSVQQMVFFQYPWGGSLAMKAELALQPEFRSQMSKSFGNDTLMYSLAKNAGLNMAFHPGMMVVNREQIGFRDFFHWTTRQILFSRLYHPTWPLVLGIGVATALVIAASLVVNLVNLWTWNWPAFMTLFSALVLYWVVWVGFVMQLDKTVSSIVQRAHQTQTNSQLRWWTSTVAVKIFLIAPFVQFVFLAGLFRAAILRRTSWRGIDYQINGPFDVKMEAYHPYRSNSSPIESHESIV